MRVGDRAWRGIVTVSPAESLAAAAELMRHHRIDHLPVVERGALVGIVTARDLDAAAPSAATTLTVREVRDRLSRIPVSQAMARDVIAVAPETPLAEAARLMRDRDLGALPVVRGDEVVGILTVSDLLAELHAPDIKP
jgi:acetoin utilization protein AcuB